MLWRLELLRHYGSDAVMQEGSELGQDHIFGEETTGAPVEKGSSLLLRVALLSGIKPCPPK